MKCRRQQGLDVTHDEALNNNGCEGNRTAVETGQWGPLGNGDDHSGCRDKHLVFTTRTAFGTVSRTKCYCNLKSQSFKLNCWIVDGPHAAIWVLLVLKNTEPASPSGSWCHDNSRWWAVFSSSGFCHLLHLGLHPSAGLPVQVQPRRYHAWFRQSHSVLLQR